MEHKPMRRLIFLHHGETVREALAHYARDIREMKAALHRLGYEVSDKDLAAAWLYRSQATAATWLRPPSDDQQLLADLLGGKFPALRLAPQLLRQCSKALLADVEDGTGDQFLMLPDDMVEALGWTVDDVIEISRDQDGAVRLHKVSES